MPWPCAWKGGKTKFKDERYLHSQVDSIMAQMFIFSWFTPRVGKWIYFFAFSITSYNIYRQDVIINFNPFKML